MTIETKYSIGDEVWCIIHNGKKVKVTAVHVIVTAVDNVIIEYSVMWNGGAWCKTENELFPTEEELLKNVEK